MSIQSRSCYSSSGSHPTHRAPGVNTTTSHNDWIQKDGPLSIATKVIYTTVQIITYLAFPLKLILTADICFDFR